MHRLPRFMRVISRRPRVRRPRIAAALLLVAIGIAAASTLLIGGRPATTAAGPTFTYGRGWTLLELERHVRAGEVAAITAGADTSSAEGTRTLYARTTAGEVVPVTLTVTPGDATAALSTLGYGQLLTKEALATSPAAASAADPMRALLNIVFAALILGGLLIVAGRRSGRSIAGLGGGRRTRFATIMPARDGDAGAAGTGGDVDRRTTKRGALGDPVRMEDVAGCDEAKLELSETIEFLRDAERFHALGAHVPRGILLHGPPGTGKTMLARAVASEAAVPFHYASGSEFVEKYVGVGARRIRDIFAQARKAGVGVIFFDEFDAIGKSRGGSNSHEEREQTLNQLLVEMDGFASTDEIVVIAATNRMDILDAALLRPGRFTRKVHVGLPDVIGRREILKVHARNKPLAADVDMDALARKTYGFSGAQLADLLNEAAIITARANAVSIGPDQLQAGWLKVAVGTSRRRAMSDRERSIIAAHEVGHAICGRIHGDKRRVEEISLFAHGEALGVTVSSQEDNDLPAESDLRARLVALMGGRAAEELLFQEVTGGASNDFEKANAIANTMVMRWGMGRDPEAVEHGSSGRGSLSFLVTHSGGSLPTDVQSAATRAIRAILDGAYATACATLVAEMPALRRIAAYLVEHERVDGDTFEALCDGRLAAADRVDDWRADSSRPRRWSDIAAFVGRRAATRAVATAAAASDTAASLTPKGRLSTGSAPARRSRPPRRGAAFKRGLGTAAYASVRSSLRRAEGWIEPGPSTDAG